MSATKKMWSGRFAGIPQIFFAIIGFVFYPFKKLLDGFLWMCEEVPDLAFLLSLFTVIGSVALGIFYLNSYMDGREMAGKEYFEAMTPCEKALAVEFLKQKKIVLVSDTQDFKKMCYNEDKSAHQLTFIEGKKE